MSGRNIWIEKVREKDAEIERLKKERDQAIAAGGLRVTSNAGLRNAQGTWFHKNDGIGELFAYLKEKESAN